MYVRTQYLSKVFNLDTLHLSVGIALDSLRAFDKISHFDSIAFTGVSGAALAFILCRELNKWPLCIRKEGNSHHSELIVEGNYESQHYVIVDDFIHSGTTVKRIADKIKVEIPNYTTEDPPELVGIYLYSSSECRTTYVIGNKSVPIIDRII